VHGWVLVPVRVTRPFVVGSHEDVNEIGLRGLFAGVVGGKGVETQKGREDDDCVRCGFLHGVTFKTLFYDFMGRR
jgi:hypothetical protein